MRADFYVAAILREPVIWGNIEGHNDKLTNHRAPYWNTDFEVFVEPSGSGHFYKEFEMNVRNATYDILWRVADGGFSNIGVPCDNNSTSWCQNSTYNQGHLPGEQSWSMVSPTCAPGGLASSTSYGGRNTATYCPFTQENASKMWTVEIAFPLRKASDHGGLLDAGDGLDYSPFDPNVNSGVFWWVDFARTQHPLIMIGESAISQPNDYAAKEYSDMCARVQKEYPTLSWVPINGHVTGVGRFRVCQERTTSIIQLYGALFNFLMPLRKGKNWYTLTNFRSDMFSKCVCRHRFVMLYPTAVYMQVILLVSWTRGIATFLRRARLG